MSNEQGPSNTELEKLKCNIEIWKKVIDVQQHFNTIEMQIRNFAVTILAGILAAAGLALRDPKNIIVYKYTISSASAILIGGIVVLLSFYFMDRFWYHRLLQGSVSRGEALETEIKKVLPEVALSQTIRSKSPVHGIRSDNKIDIFYGIIVLFLLISAIGVHWGTNASIPTDDVFYSGFFNVSIIEDKNATDLTNILGFGTIEFKSNKTVSDLGLILSGV